MNEGANLDDAEVIDPQIISKQSKATKNGPRKVLNTSVKGNGRKFDHKVTNINNNYDTSS
jgi:hypothetical protein